MLSPLNFFHQRSTDCVYMSLFLGFLFCSIGLYINVSLFLGGGLFIYLFMAVLGLRFCARALSSCGKWGPLFIAVRGPLTIAASLVAEHRLQMRRLSNCGSRAQLLHGMWDLPRPGLEPMSPALAGSFPTTAPPGKPRNYNLRQHQATISCWLMETWACLQEQVC